MVEVNLIGHGSAVVQASSVGITLVSGDFKCSTLASVRVLLKKAAGTWGFMALENLLADIKSETDSELF